MFNIYKKTSFLIFFAIAILQFNCSVYAAYEVVNATTIINENEETKSSNEYRHTFNDPDFNDDKIDNETTGILDRKLNSFLEKRRKKKLEKQQTEEISQEEIVQEEELEQKNTPIQNQAPKQVYTQENIKNKNTFQINADKITYDDDEGNVYAKGNVEIIAKEQGVALKADEAILDKTSQTIKLHDNVKIIKDGAEMSGEYLLIDLNEQNILMDNPTLEAYSFKIAAQEGYLIANDLQMINGTIKSAKEADYPLQTRGFNRINNISSYYLNTRKKDTIQKGVEHKYSYKINAKEITLTSFKDHNTLELKDADIYFNNHKIARGANIEILSDKQNEVHEINAPEAGTLRAFGTYVGYGFVFKLPKGQTFKFMPVVAYGESNIGVGVIGRHRSKNSILEAGWNTATTNVVARGRYKLGKGVELRYGRNAYMPEGFMGARRSGYAAQLQFAKAYHNSDLNIRFNHGFYAGLFSDYQKHDQEDAFATTRFRYIAEIRKPIMEYKNKEQDLSVAINALAQGAATVYGSGETFGVARIGPYVTTKVRRWESSIGYLFSGIHGDSPFIFDKYRYGKSTIQLNERFNFNDKFALGYRAYVSPLKDNYEDRLLTESRFYAIFGPQDLKLAVSYDFVRDIAHLDFLFLIGANSSKINFEKFSTKNADGGQQKQDFYKKTKVKIEDPENI